jgi:hypothetical protein
MLIVSSAVMARLEPVHSVTIPPNANAIIVMWRMCLPTKLKVPLIISLLKAVFGPT